MIINFDARHGAEYYGIDQTFRFIYGVHTAPAYGFPEVQQDFIALNQKIDSIINKLPDDFIAGSEEATSLESRHSVGSWRTGSTGGGGGGGGGYVSTPSVWTPKEKRELIRDIVKLKEMLEDGFKKLKPDDTKKELGILKSDIETQLIGIKSQLNDLKTKVENEGKTNAKKLLKEIEEAEQDIRNGLEKLAEASTTKELEEKLEELSVLVVKLLPDSELEALLDECD